MRFRCSILLLTALLAFGQIRMTVDQLRAFVESSQKLGHPDKKVAEYVRNIKLSEKLDDSTIEDLQSLGAGPKTVEALKALATTSSTLPAPAPPPVSAPKPVAREIPPPSSEDQARVLQEAREYAMEYTKKLPNFICTQVTRRYADPSGLEFWQSMDTVVAKLSYSDNHEDYKVILVNDRVVDTTMDKLEGATSRGEFGSMMREVFEPSTRAAFQWERWGTLRGRRMHVYSYRVEQANSQWHVIYEKTYDIVPAYKGLVYVDRDSSAVMRITFEATDMPYSFPVQQATSVLDYDLAEIAGSQYIVPLKASIRMRSGKQLNKNEVEFRFYKKFGAEATIKIGAPLPDDKELPPVTK